MVVTATCTAGARSVLRLLRMRRIVERRPLGAPEVLHTGDASVATANNASRWLAVMIAQNCLRDSGGGGGVLRLPLHRTQMQPFI